MKTFLLFALFLTPLISHAEDDGCTAAEPSALLDKAEYKDHSFQKEKKIPNGAKEAATLADGTKLQIEFGGCVDVLTKTFKFSLKDSHPAGDQKFWTASAKKKFDELKFLKDWKPLQEEISKFLAKAAALPNSVKNGTSIAISECMDGSKATRDGCSFEQLGRYELKVKKSGSTATLTITHSNNL